ncbi:MAG: SWIM zinc finger family protein [Thermoplasmatota archaeon]
MSWGYYPRYEKTTPKAVKNGIRTRSKRGDIGETWWSRRWIEVLESLGMGARLGRGKRYARMGQVVSIDIERGKVSAKVQGSRSKPYMVTIELKPLSGKDWEKVEDAMSSRAVFAAKLLAGEMPQNIEEVFSDCKVSLFPAKSRDLETDCSCPDWANPCKHIAAVYFILAERFDEDPFLIFRLRGMEKTELIDALKERRNESPSVEIEKLPETENISGFWNASSGLKDVEVMPRPPEVEFSALARMGKIPLRKQESWFLNDLKDSYRYAQKIALSRSVEDGNSGGGD